MSMTKITDAAGEALTLLSHNSDAIKSALESNTFVIRCNKKEIPICTILSAAAEKLGFASDSLPQDDLVLPYSIFVLEPSYDFNGLNPGVDTGRATDKLDILLSRTDRMDEFVKAMKVTKYFESICYRHQGCDVSTRVKKSGLDPCHNCEVMAESEADLPSSFLKINYLNATVPLFLWTHQRTKEQPELPIIRTDYRPEDKGDQELIQKWEGPIKDACANLTTLSLKDREGYVGLMSLCATISIVLEHVQSIELLARAQIEKLAAEADNTSEVAEVIAKCIRLKAQIYNHGQNIFSRTLV